MYLNMNNFSDLLDIKPDLAIRLQLTPVGTPHIAVRVNQHCVWQGLLTVPWNCELRHPLTDPLQVTVELMNKNYKVDSTSAVIVEQLSIDQFDLVPNWTHLIDYQNDHNYQDPTNYLGFNGAWCLDINRPFYHWLHHVSGQGWLLKP